MDEKQTLTLLMMLYAIPGKIDSFRQLTNGHINKTYYVNITLENGGEDEYIFQRINTYVFSEPLKIMRNISRVNHHLAGIDRTGHCGIVEYLNTRSGENYAVLDDGSFWRAYRFVPNSVAYEYVERPSVLYNAGFAFADFIGQLSELDPSEMDVIIPDFHNTRKRLDDFFDAVERDPLGRAKDCAEEIEFFRSHREEAECLCRLQESGRLPLRVVHNDTKYNNILIDPVTDEPLCVIDLDTIMAGLTAYDYGDAIRFAASTAEEDETDLSKVALDLDRFRLFTEGFMKGASFLTQEEADTLVLGAPAITIELASRFLADHLLGDKYFRIARPGHNRDRARCQAALAADMLKRLPEMQEIAAAARK